MKLLVFSGACLAATAAQGARPIIAFDQICPASPQAGDRRFSPADLLNAGLDAKGVSSRAIDRNGDGDDTLREKIDTVLLDPCVSESRCKDERSKISAVQILLLGSFERSDLRIERKRPPPTTAERLAEPWLDIEADEQHVGSIAELIDPGQRFLQVSCISSDADNLKPKAAGLPIGLRVTSKLDELTLPRTGEDDLKVIDAATISIADDDIADRLTFAIDAIVGVHLPLDEAGNSVTPFVQYRRTSVRDKSVSPAVADRSLDKLGLGATFEIWPAPADAINVSPIYVVDYREHSRVLSAKANWIPGVLRRIEDLPVGGAQPLVPDFLFYRIIPRLLLQGSHVFAAGTNAELLDTSDYLRFGSDLAADFWGAGPILSDFTAGVSWRRLWRLTRGPRTVSLLKANLQYWLGS